MVFAPDRAGPRHPVRSTPARPPGSWRRTSTIDSTFPDGIDGGVLVDARARDLVTAADGTVAVMGKASLGARLEGPSRAILDIWADPPEPGLDALVGVPVAGGFRAAAVAAVGDHAEGRTLLNLLVDDLPGASLVSGYVVQRARPEIGRIADGEAPGSYLDAAIGICAGWQRDGSILVTFGRTGEIPTPLGPPAPLLESGGDPWAWHDLAALPAHSTRRRRRMDLWPDRAGRDRWCFEAHFRDSHADEAGAETVVHEYLVEGTLDAATATILDISARAPVLPWLECPSALDSAGRLVGQPLDDLRRVVRRDFVGQSTCTHLNDTLRALADLDRLLHHAVASGA
jgi:hypothetical protein